MTPFGSPVIGGQKSSPEENSCIPITHFQCKTHFEHLLTARPLPNDRKPNGYSHSTTENDAHDERRRHSRTNAVYTFFSDANKSEPFQRRSEGFRRVLSPKQGSVLFSQAHHQCTDEEQHHDGKSHKTDGVRGAYARRTEFHDHLMTTGRYFEGTQHIVDTSQF